MGLQVGTRHYILGYDTKRVRHAVSHDELVETSDENVFLTWTIGIVLNKYNTAGSSVCLDLQK